MASTSGYGYSLTANCSNLRRSGDTVYVDVSISGSSYYSGSLYIDGVSVGSSWSSANGGSSSGSRTLSWNNPGVFSSRDITCRLKYQIQRGGSTSNAYVYPSTGSLGARTYTVSYNKGANGSGTNTSDTKTYGTALTLKGAIFTRTGYTQTGWSTSDGGSKAYNLSASYTTNAAVTLYPYWTANTYTVSYNKGANGTGTNTSDTKTYGVALTLKGAIFTRSGYTQTGWSTSDGGSKAYNLSASYTSDAAVTLYPYWEKDGFNIYRASNGTVKQVTAIYSVNNGVVKQITDVYKVNNGTVTHV